MRPAPHDTPQVAVKVLEVRGGNHELIEDVHRIARAMNRRRFENYCAAEEKRVSRHRNLFTMLPDCRAADALKDAMLQRAYDLLWDGDGTGCDAILEFVPSDEAEAMLNAWSDDQEGKKPPSKWYAV